VIREDYHQGPMGRKSVQDERLHHIVSGVRVRSKMVPAVTEDRLWQPERMNLPSASRQPGVSPQSGQMNPLGQRNHSK